MKIYYEKYIDQEKQLPDLGKNIIGQSDNESVIVYQAFNNNVADFAIKNQAFGGDSFSFNRMTWIKPNFLWMMYRAGWATKVNQERILALRITNQGFIDILKQAVHSTFKPDIYKSYEFWKQKLDNSEVRLQWDPDHNPFGEKKERKAIQLGLKGSILKKYCSEWIVEIIDLTDFVKSEKSKLDSLAIDDLIVPVERIIEVLDDELKKTLEITGYNTQ
jgi:hypothetical protein